MNGQEDPIDHANFFLLRFQVFHLEVCGVGGGDAVKNYARKENTPNALLFTTLASGPQRGGSTTPEVPSFCGHTTA